MKKNIKKGFTLIELLVVITIIGILATGAVTVYTGQMTKARDSVRSTDIKAIQGALEQAFLDNGAYPLQGTAFTGALNPFLPNPPTDPRTGTAQGGTALDYLYNVSQDAAGVPEQEYEVSMGVERAIPLTSTDGGNDALRIEVGVNVSDAQHRTARQNAIPAAINMGECVNATTGTAVVSPCVNTSPMLIE